MAPVYSSLVFIDWNRTLLRVLTWSLLRKYYFAGKISLTNFISFLILFRRQITDKSIIVQIIPLVAFSLRFQRKLPFVLMLLLFLLIPIHIILQIKQTFLLIRQYEIIQRLLIRPQMIILHSKITVIVHSRKILQIIRKSIIRRPSAEYNITDHSITVRTHQFTSICNTELLQIY